MASRVVTAAALRNFNLIVTNSGLVVKPNELDSAISRPLNTQHYEPERPVTYLAATLSYGLIMGHPFLDGNKRTAHHAAELYLGDGGYAIKGGKEALLSAAHAKVASSEMTVEQLAEVYAEAFAKIK
jgi:death-on-curing family protein